MSLEGCLLGHYRLQHLIGSGGMGEIYLAEDTHIPRQVAVKVLRIEKDLSVDHSTAQEAERLFVREMKAISLLDHPHILPVFDYGTGQIGTIAPTYLVMPYRPEGSLLDWLRKQEGNMLLDPAKVVQILLQAADALQHAHERQILHQDVKLSNFLIRIRNRAADVPDILLADFGIARFINATASASQSVRGTPTYMAPEQWEGCPVPASDQYALAIMAFQLLTGQTPFRGSLGQVMRQHYSTLPPAPSSLNTQLTSQVDAVLLRALAKRPEERFPSVLQFAQALQQIFPYDASHISYSISTVDQYVPQTAAPAIPPGQFIAQSIPSQDPQQRTVVHHPSYPSRDFAPIDMPPLPSVQPSATTLSLSSTQRTPLSEQLVPAVSSNSQPSPHSRFSRPQKLWLTAIALLVILGGSNIVFYTLGRSAGTGTRKGIAAHNTAQAMYNRGAATATAIAQAFQHATATASAIANDPYLTGKGTLILSDPLSGPGNWGTETSGPWGGTCAFRNGAYYMTETVVTHSFGCNIRTLMQERNFIYRVQMTFVRGNCGGLRFRYDPTLHFGYVLRLCPDGLTVLNASSKAGYAVLLYTNSSAVRRGYNRSNILAVTAVGNRLTVYINRQIVGSCIDINNTFSSGVFAFDIDASDQPTDIAFSDAKIWRL